MSPRVTFSLPPSMGDAFTSRVSARLGPFLTEALRDLASPVVSVAPTYADLSLDLLQGRSDVAWGPPSVCARLEVHGGRTLVQSVRKGASTYRSAFVRRRGDDVVLEKLEGKIAAWVDPDSTGGYLLACAELLRRGIDLRGVLKRQRFMRSYRAAAESVALEEADLAAVFATSANAEQRRSALDELEGALQARLEVFAYTAETPNDGVVARPGLPADVAALIVEKLVDARHSDEGRQLLREVFNVDGFEPAPKDAYAALHEIVLGTVR